MVQVQATLLSTAAQLRSFSAPPTDRHAADEAHAALTNAVSTCGATLVAAAESGKTQNDSMSDASLEKLARLALAMAVYQRRQLATQTLTLLVLFTCSLTFLSLSQNYHRYS